MGSCGPRERPADVAFGMWVAGLWFGMRVVAQTISDADVEERGGGPPGHGELALVPHLEVGRVKWPGDIG